MLIFKILVAYFTEDFNITKKFLISIFQRDSISLNPLNYHLTLALSIHKILRDAPSEQHFQHTRWLHLLGKITLLFLCLIGFLFSIELIESLFRTFASDIAFRISSAISHPFLGLFLGLLATAIVQSSSTTTALIVAMASAGILQTTQAVPMVMGANVGTTITAMLVAFAQISNKRQFRKAFAAALLHNLFNICTVILLLPFEYFGGFISGAAMYFTHSLAAMNNGSANFMLLTIKPLVHYFEHQTNHSPAWALAVALMMLPVSIFSFSALLKSIAIGNAQRLMEDKVFGSPTLSLFWGMILTGLVRSSAVTTSFAVPLVGAERVSLKKVFPFVLGANIGTTITALLAAFARQDVALSIAITHLLFNVIGVLIVFPWPLLRNSFVWLTKKITFSLTVSRSRALLYMLIIFFALPIIALYLGLK